MPEPTISNVHVDVPLSNISIAWKNSLYIADQMSPRVQVDKQSNSYFEWDKEYWFRNYVQERTPGDTYPEAGLKLSTDSFHCRIFNLAFPLPDEVMANQDQAIQLEITGAEWLADQFMLNREIKARDKYFTTGTWGTDVVGTTNFTKWSDFATSDPLSDILAGQDVVHKATGIRPTQTAMGIEVWNKLKEHPLILDKYRYTNPGAAIMTPEQVAAYLGLTEIIIGQAVGNTAREGASTPFVGGYIWGDDVLLYHKAASPGLMTPSACYTFEWDIQGMSLPVTVTRLRQDDRDRDLLRAKYAFDQKVVASILGYFFNDVI